MGSHITQVEARKLVAAVKRILDALASDTVRDVDIGHGEWLSGVLIDALPDGEEL